MLVVRTLCVETRRATSLRFLQQSRNLRNIFSNNVKFQIYQRSNLDCVEVSVVESVGNDAHLERVLRWAADGQAHTVDGYRALIHSQIAASCHLFVEIVLEGENVASFGVFNLCAACRFIDVALHNVTVQSAVHQH